MLILEEYALLCLSNPVPETLFEDPNYWKFQIEAICFDLVGSINDPKLLRRLVYCLYRLRQLHSPYDLKLLEDSFINLVDMVKDNRFGSIFSFGKNDFQLGFGSDVNLQSVPHRINNLGDERISFKSIAAGRYHTAAISSEGGLFTWGKGQGGKLGHDNEKTYIIPTRIHLNVKVTQIALGRYHSLAIVEDGSVYVWGSNKFGQLGLGNVSNSLKPVKIGVNRRKGISRICSIGASKSHSICVREDGGVFCWGKNDSSQLGFRAISQDAIQSTPYKVSNDSFNGHQPSKTACSESVSLVLTVDGRVFQWGQGAPKPSKVLFTKKTNTNSNTSEWQHKEETTNEIVLTNISAAPYHCAAVSSKGEIFTWGSEANLLGYSYVGDERVKSHTTMGRRIDHLYEEGVYIRKVECAKRHSIAIDTNGFVWVWGHGDHGVLGLTEKQTYQPEPKRISSLRAIKDIAAAECHSCVILEEVLYSSLYKTSNEIEKGTHLVERGDIDDSSSDTENEDEVVNIKETEVNVLSSLQELGETHLLKEADIWNILGFLRFGLLYGLKAIIERSQLLILLNFLTLVVNQKDFLRDLCDIYDFKVLLGEKYDYSNIEEDSKITSTPFSKPRFRRGSISSLSSLTTLDSLNDWESQQTCDTPVKEKLVEQNNKEVKSQQKHKRSQEFRCDVCNISVHNKKALAEHLSGKKHRKNTQNDKPRKLQISCPPTPKFKPQKSVMLPAPMETKKESPVFQFIGSDFPEPSLAASSSCNRKTRTPKIKGDIRKSAGGGYSLNDFLNQRKGKPSQKSQKPSVWKEMPPTTNVCTNLCNIMSEQSMEVQEVTLRQSSWGYNKVSTASLAAIQQQQQHEEMIREQRRMLNKFKRKQQRKRRQMKKKAQNKIKSAE